MYENQGHTPFTLDALLLLFGLPLVLTFIKFVVLEIFGERSHQLFADAEYNQIYIKSDYAEITLYLRSLKRALSDLCNVYNNLSSEVNKSDHSLIILSLYPIVLK